MNVGERIKDLLTDMDKTQKKMAEELSVHPGTMSGYLTDKHQMPFDVLAAIAKYLDVTTDYLLGCTDVSGIPLRLSDSERRLILDLRTLNPDQKALAAHMILYMAEQNRK